MGVMFEMYNEYEYVNMLLMIFIFLKYQSRFQNQDLFFVPFDVHLPDG